MVKSISLPNNPFISIVIPAMDLKVIRAINSILRIKSSFSFEIIVIFNNCDYKVVERIIKIFYTQKNTGILKIVYLTRSTIGGARNAGIKIATGNYIIHMDSDCEVRNDYLKNISFVTQKEFLVARGDVLFFSSDNFLDIANCKLRDFIYKTQKKICYTPNLIINIKLHKNGFIFDDKNLHGEDTELSIRFERQAIYPIFLPEVIMFHKDELKTLDIIKKYFYYGIARAYRFKKWNRKIVKYKFYQQLFGEINICSLKNIKPIIRLGILFLYFCRNMGVIYACITHVFSNDGDNKISELSSGKPVNIKKI
ncbi:MAG: glycosyltransferase family 2 protein [Patescibacteria group bacterium]